MTFESLGLEPRLLKAVAAMNYTEPTPIQAAAIPHVLAGSDVLGIAQTGTGKTAAFVLPTLQRVGTRGGIRMLVVTPTRELAMQIAEVAREASRFTGHRVATVFGGVGLQPQINTLRRGVDIVIACPGRLLDLHQRRALDLSKVETLVLDEADRMLDMGFWPDVRRILSLLPEKRQNLLFSATMSRDVLGVIDSTLVNPVRVETSPPATPVDLVTQSVYPVAGDQKTDLLVELLKTTGGRVLVFTRTKHRADRLSRQLTRHGVLSEAIHGNRSQAQRQRALDAFKGGRFDVLVATDVVSRGIDINEISHVVNYDMPNSPDDYVHRIGRTARAGHKGNAVSFLAIEEMEVFQAIERRLGVMLECRDVEGFDYARRSVPSPDRQINPSRPQGGQGGGQGNRSGRQGSRNRVADRNHRPGTGGGGQDQQGRGERYRGGQGGSQDGGQSRGRGSGWSGGAQSGRSRPTGDRG
ncbi:MAG: DEAD/DEAH box helicase [Thermoleophilia bacterium]